MKSSYSGFPEGLPIMLEPSGPNFAPHPNGMIRHEARERLFIHTPCYYTGPVFPHWALSLLSPCGGPSGDLRPEFCCAPVIGQAEVLIGITCRAAGHYIQLSPFVFPWCFFPRLTKSRGSIRALEQAQTDNHREF